MSRIKFKHGVIFAIPLFYDLGWSFAKYIDSNVINPRKDGRRHIYEGLIKFYNHFTEEPKYEDINFNEIDFLLDPLVVGGLTSHSYKKNGWEIIGYQELSEEDYYLPKVKSFWPPILIHSEEYMIYDNIFQVGNKEGIITSNKEDVDRLEFSDVRGLNIIRFRITIEYLKLNGLDIKKEYGFDAPIYEIEYNNVFNSPLLPPLSLHVKK